MKTWIYLASASSALWLALACADGDETSDNTGGAGGAGATAGDDSGETGGTVAGGAPGNGAGGQGQAGEPAVTCEPPEPPLVGAGGASSGAGGAGSGAGGEAGAAVGTAALAIVGSYVDDFDGAHTVSSATWTIGDSVFNIAAFDGAAHWLVAQNDQGNDFFPCLWSRFDWSEADGVLYYCQTVYSAESQAAALAIDAPDSADLATGCNGFSWSSLTAR